MKKPSLFLLIPIFVLEAIIRLIIVIFDLVKFVAIIPFILVHNWMVRLLFAGQVKEEIKQHKLNIEEVLNNPKYKPMGRWDK